jgi:hypothetical protein
LGDDVEEPPFYFYEFGVLDIGFDILEELFLELLDLLNDLIDSLRHIGFDVISFMYFFLYYFQH